MALFLDLEIGDAVRVGDDTVIRLEAKSGKRARLRIQSHADVELVKDSDPTPTGLQRSPPHPEPAPPAPHQASVFVRRPPAG